MNNFKNTIKNRLFKFMSLSGVSNIVRLYKQNDIQVVLYHGVIDDELPYGVKSLGGMIKREIFVTHLNYYEQHYNVISFEQFAEAMQNGITIPKALLITFDDGYRSTFTNGLPLLEDFGFPATIFVTTSSVDNNNVLWPNLFSFAIEKKGTRYLTSKLIERGFTPKLNVNSASLIYNISGYCSPEIIDDCYQDIITENDSGEVDLCKKLLLYVDKSQIASSHSKYITIGSHTLNHKNLAALQAKIQEQEIYKAHKLISELTEVPFEDVPFAFPFGGYNRHFNDITISICKSLGIKHLFAADGGTNVASNHSAYYNRKFVPVTIDKPFELDSTLLRN
jgi:peptidoglycan/xylan/chitin deacetylase (PgdA/CDA1 family)